MIKMGVKIDFVSFFKQARFFFPWTKNDRIHKPPPELFPCPNIESDIDLESLGPTAWHYLLGFLDFSQILELERVLEHANTGKSRQNVNLLQSAPKLAIRIRISYWIRIS